MTKIKFVIGFHFLLVFQLAVLEVAWSNIGIQSNLYSDYCLDHEKRDLPPEGRALAVDKHGEVYVAGNFYDSADFDPSPKQQILRSKGFKIVDVPKRAN
ncbi:MAG: hypothetical protein U5L96_17995 [Owenweeksia sp.]|nr:hypothetical protein [Owenweeksia sp.]